MIAAAWRLARRRDSSLGQIFRDALARELRRANGPAKVPNRAEEQLLAPLRVLLAPDFALAQNWADLKRRLRAHGYTLREAGGGLALHSHPADARVCKASDLGHAYASLMRRFGAPFPEHSHRYLADKLLAPAHPAPADFDLIEPF